MPIILRRASLETVLACYGGTQLGRQEIDGDIIDQRSDALWSRAHTWSAAG